MSTPTLDDLAATLGVSSKSLNTLGVSRSGQTWRIPERDAEGSVIGHALRFDDGRKLSERGSRRGLTFVAPLDAWAGSSPEEPVLVVEGMSDCAAALDLGFCAVGRPSATGGGEHLRALLSGRHVCIVGENDSGAGRLGAERIADALHGVAASVRIVFPPESCKDLRTWYTAPAPVTRDELLTLISRTDAWEPTDDEAPVPRVDAFEPFPVEALPEPVSDFVRDGANAIGCDPAYVALPTLAALASAIGNTRRIRLKSNWCEPSILWAGIVGDSGTLKTPGFKLSMQFVRERQAVALKEHAEAMALHDRELAQYERAMAAWKRSKNSDEPPVKPEAPQARRFVVSDTTVEALAPILRGNPRGVLLARDELAGWIAGFDRYAGRGGADAAHWLSMHNAESVVVDRKTGLPRTIYIPRASVSIAGGIQPGILKRVIGEEHRESGLLARLLLAMPPRRPKRWTEATIPPHVEAAMANLFDRLFALQPTLDSNGDPQPIDLPLTPTGKSVWIAFYNEHAEEQAALTGDLAAAWSKLEGGAARLALVVHCARAAVGDCASDAIDEKSVASGVTLARWFAREARRVYGVLSEGEQDAHRRRLVELIERKGGSISARELVHADRRRFAKVDDAEAAQQSLVDARLGEWEQPPQLGRGRPSGRRLVLRNRDNVTARPNVSNENNDNESPPVDSASPNNVVVVSVDAQQTRSCDVPSSQRFDPHDSEVIG